MMAPRIISPSTSVALRLAMGMVLSWWIGGGNGQTAVGRFRRGGAGVAGGRVVAGQGMVP